MNICWFRIYQRIEWFFVIILSENGLYWNFNYWKYPENCELQGHNWTIAIFFVSLMEQGDIKMKLFNFILFNTMVHLLPIIGLQIRHLFLILHLYQWQPFLLYNQLISPTLYSFHLHHKNPFFLGFVFLCLCG